MPPTCIVMLLCSRCLPFDSIPKPLSFQVQALHQILLLWNYTSPWPDRAPVHSLRSCTSALSPPLIGVFTSVTSIGVAQVVCHMQGFSVAVSPQRISTMSINMQPGVGESMPSKFEQTNVNLHKLMHVSTTVHDPNHPLCGVKDNLGGVCVHSDTPNGGTWTARKSISRF